MVVTDADGMVLWRAGSNGDAAAGRCGGLHRRCRWTETAGAPTPSVRRWWRNHRSSCSRPSTTPVQTARLDLHRQSPCTIREPGRCSAWSTSPGRLATAHPETVALVRTAVRLAQAELWRQREAQLNVLRTVAGSTLRGSSWAGPAVVDPDGWIAAVNGYRGHRAGARPGRRPTGGDPGPGPLYAGSGSPAAGCCATDPETAGSPVRLWLDLNPPDAARGSPRRSRVRGLAIPADSAPHPAADVADVGRVRPADPPRGPVHRRVRR